MVGAIGIMPSTVDIAVSMIGWKGFLMLAGLAGGELWPLAFMMTKISYSGYRFPSGDHSAGRLALCPFHLELLQEPRHSRSEDRRGHRWGRTQGKIG
jgi:hypothetical protein